jgi:y4mF family transcriptional regulator
MARSDANLTDHTDHRGPLALGATVRNRRRDLGLTQEDAADLAGVSARFLHEVETGKDTVRLATLLRLLEALGLHLELRRGASPVVEVESRQ